MSDYDPVALGLDDTIGTDEGGWSRSNEDEIIQRLLKRVGCGNRVCVDIGAKSIENSNVANLIVNQGWRGILIDRGIKNFHRLFNEFPNMSLCLIYATALPKNVNDLLPQHFQLLSIDIDGQDYYLWQAVSARPPVVVIEYNPRLSGIQVMSRDDRYEWKKNKDYERYGASQEALVKLARRKGYSLADKNHDNLFFTLD